MPAFVAEDVVAVAAGSNHSCAIKAEGNRLSCWGDNEFNQCKDEVLGEEGTAVETE